MNDTARWKSYQRYLYILAKVVLAAIALVVAYWFFVQLRDVLLTIGLSFLIAYLLAPVVRWMERRGLNRTLAIFLLMFVGLGLFVAFILVFAPTLADELQTLATQTIPEAIGDIRGWYIRANDTIEGRTGYGLPRTFEETFSSYGQKLQDMAASAVQRLTSATGQVLSASWSVIAYLINLLLIPLFVFYYLRDFEKITATLSALIPLTHRDRVLNKIHRIDSIVGDWFRGQLTVCGILGVLYSLGLVILDVKLGLLIGLFAGLLHIIPYLGFVVGMSLGLIMSAVDDTSGWGQFFGVIATFTLVQTLEAYVITPKIVGERVGLSPLMVIIVVLVGGQLFGFWGVLLAVPVAGVLRVFILDAVADYKRSRFFLGEDNLMTLLSRGAAAVPSEARQALREAAEADLDMRLPTPLSDEELRRLAQTPHEPDPAPVSDPAPIPDIRPAEIPPAEIPPAPASDPPAL